jgi:periplasmic divalent cation tolerance protein
MSETKSAAAETRLLLVLCTFPSQDSAGEIANALVGEGLAACVSMVREVRSIYRWNNEIVNNTEVLCLIKTQKACHDDLLRRISELHPYDVPELVTLSPEHVNERYLSWVVGQTAPTSAS